jgi:hypothetical protein
MKIRHIIALALLGLVVVNLSAMKRLHEENNYFDVRDEDNHLDMNIVLNLGQGTEFTPMRYFPKTRVINGTLTVQKQQKEQAPLIIHRAPTLQEFPALFDNIRTNNVKAFEKSLKKGITLANDDFLIYAITYNKPEIIKLLIHSGTLVSPYHSSHLFCVDNVETAQLLLDNGVDTEIPTHWGDTPLIMCAAHGNVPVVKELICHGADITAINTFGRTAYDSACLYMDDFDDEQETIKEELENILRNEESVRTVITDNFAARFGQNVFLSLIKQQRNGTKK